MSSFAAEADGPGTAIPRGIKNWRALAWVFARASLATLFSLFSLHALLGLCLLK